MENTVGSARVFGTNITKLSRFYHKTPMSMLLNFHIFALRWRSLVPNSNHAVIEW